MHNGKIPDEIKQHMETGKPIKKAKTAKAPRTKKVYQKKLRHGVNQYDLEGKLVATFKNAEQASEIIGVHPESIRNCCKGIKYYNTAGGYLWEFSDERKRKLLKARKKRQFSDEHRKKLSDAKKGNKISLGRKQSPEHIAKLSKARKGRKRTEETKKKISESVKKARAKSNGNKAGKVKSTWVFTDELKELCKNNYTRPKKGYKIGWKRKKEMSERMKGKAFFKGKKHSEESKQLLSEKNKTKRAVQQYSLQGELIASFDSTRKASQLTGASRTAITKCCKGKPRYKTAGGFRWKYPDQSELS